MEKQHKFVLRLSKETFAKLKKIATRELRSINTVIRIAIEQYLKKQKDK
ncbi:hypothetical protein LCGC14_1499250 [marine sediment metagenome]|uniref:Arc-like DNA binding domain-containing protein n=1 Tax=marine sediment metagenome TaxID=412755 RepID=A0A0F9M603_9ZZZZ